MSNESSHNLLPQAAERGNTAISVYQLCTTKLSVRMGQKILRMGHFNSVLSAPHKFSIVNTSLKAVDFYLYIKVLLPVHNFGLITLYILTSIHLTYGTGRFRKIEYSISAAICMDR